MIENHNCFNRKCKNFIRSIYIKGEEISERHCCYAYIDGIPDEIAYGNDLHLRIREDQENKYTFEEGKPTTLKLKKIEPVEIDKNGKKVFNIGADEVGADPFRAGRLAKKARAGDEEARKELERMQNTDMYRLIEEDYDNSEEY